MIGVVRAINGVTRERLEDHQAHAGKAPVPTADVVEDYNDSGLSVRQRFHYEIHHYCKVKHSVPFFSMSRFKL